MPPKAKNLDYNLILSSYGDGIGLKKIAKKCGCDHRRIKRILLGNGIQIRSQPVACRLAYEKGHVINPTLDNHPSWRGGKITTLQGYTRLKIPSHRRANHHGYVLEHIVIWENFYNKNVTRDFSIHHLNGIKNDNRIENLCLLKKNEHHRLAEPYKKRIKELEVQIANLQQKSLFIEYKNE